MSEVTRPLSGIDAVRLSAVAAKAAAAALGTQHAEGFADGLSTAVRLLEEAAAAERSERERRRGLRETIGRIEVRPDGPETAEGGLIGQEPY